MEQVTFTTNTTKRNKNRRKTLNDYKWKIVTVCAVATLAVTLALILTYSLRSNSGDVQHQTVRQQKEVMPKPIMQDKWNIKRDIQLPKNLHPLQYHLHLNVNMDEDRYDGTVNISFVVDKSTSFIVFHQNGLRILKTFITVARPSINRTERIRREYYYEPNEFYILEMLKPLVKGHTYWLFVIFKGEVRSKLNGFHKSYYTERGVKRKVASTFLSPIAARKVFPCFDEPRYKAIFRLSLTHSNRYHAIANANPLRTIRRDKYTVTRDFQPTLKMSTYILGWVISEYNYVSYNKTSGLKIRAWAPPKDLPNTGYALSLTHDLLKFYESYFNISYPLNKIDIVEITSLSPGAMENWGLITFRPEKMLYNKNASEIEKQSIVKIVAHELVHQWFGNLATMKFWNDVWLKEGFANYIGLLGGDKIEPSMMLMKKSLDVMLPALELDSYSTSHPISGNPKTSQDIRDMFDMITYRKGHCIVQMIHEYLGDDFQKGLQRYLKTYRYKNADQNDLWKQLSLASGKDVKSVMDTWTLQLGYPVITAERIDDKHIRIEQARFTLDLPNAVVPKSPFDYEWQVPIRYKTINTNRVSTYLLKNKSGIIKSPNGCILNPKHKMFYKVNYKGSMLDMVKRTLLKNSMTMSVEDKVGLIYDQFSMAAANLSSIKHALDMTLYIKTEREYFPWKVTLDQLNKIYSMADDDDILKVQLQSYVRNLTSSFISKVGWKGTLSAHNGLLQAQILLTQCIMNDHNTVKQAKFLYQDWMSGRPMKTSVDLYPTAMKCGIMHGGDKEWKYGFAQYMKKVRGSSTILKALTYTRNETLIKRMLSLTNTMIDRSDAPYVIGGIASHSQLGRRLAWSHVKKYWKNLLKKYEEELFSLNDMLASVLENFSNDSDYKDIEQFFRTPNERKEVITQSLAKIGANIAWKKINTDEMKQWLNAHQHS